MRAELLQPVQADERVAARVGIRFVAAAGRLLVRGERKCNSDRFGYIDPSSTTVLLMQPPPSSTLRAIAVFKLAKGLILVILGLGLLRFLHQDFGAFVERCLEQFRIDPENRYATAILAKAGLLNGKSIPLVSGLTFGYAAIFWIEGIGLYLRKRWA